MVLGGVCGNPSVPASVVVFGAISNLGATRMDGEIIDDYLKQDKWHENITTKKSTATRIGAVMNQRVVCPLLVNGCKNLSKKNLGASMVI
jgi:hypothetical protein